MSKANRDNSSETLPQAGLHQAAENLVHAKQRQVLLVEDTAAHAAIILRGIDSSRWSVNHVTRGSAAIESYSANPYQIVLLDLSLPDTDGLSLLSRLRAINANSSIVVVTSTDQVKVSVEAMQRGAGDYVVKGDPKETSANIALALERAYAARLRQAELHLIEQTKIAEMVKAERLEAIELIVRTVCHEVNNPLSGVVALSQLLCRNDRLDEDLRRLAEGITRSANEVAEVVRKLHGISDDPVTFGGQQILAPQPEK